MMIVIVGCLSTMMIVIVYHDDSHSGMSILMLSCYNGALSVRPTSAHIGTCHMQKRHAGCQPLQNEHDVLHTAILFYSMLCSWLQ